MSETSKKGGSGVGVDNRGGALLEGALAAPVFLMFFLGIVGWNFFLFKQVVVQYGAEAAARCKTMPYGPNGMLYCVDAQTAGVQSSLGFASKFDIYDANNPSLTCLSSSADNPLSFIPFISLPIENRGSFCRPTL